jgi:hypothetical protein
VQIVSRFVLQVEIMNDKTLSERQIDDPFDRRQAGNTSVQWVREAFKEQNAKIDLVAADVREISANLKKSWRDGDSNAHWDDHELFKQREKEFQRLEAERQIKEEERKKFWEKIKADVIAYSLKAAGLFVVGVIVLGTQAKFKEWVHWAVSEPAQEVKK